MARCDEGYRCEVCGRDVEAVTDSDLYLRYVLGEVPLEMEIRETSDSGRPVVVSDPDGPQAKVYRAIARRVRERLDQERGGAEAAIPSIVFE